MPAKKPVSFGTRPGRSEADQAVEDWVRTETGEPESKDLKQIIIRVSPDLYKRIRHGIIERETSVNKLVNDFLEREFPPEQG
jgi:predicted HicB family RNase H-like nuclease